MLSNVTISAIITNVIENLKIKLSIGDEEAIKLFYRTNIYEMLVKQDNDLYTRSSKYLTELVLEEVNSQIEENNLTISSDISKED